MTVAAPFVIGVAGGTGSGKSTVADRVIAVAGHRQVAVIALDSYYRDDPHLPIEQRAKINYDHPDAFDWPLYIEHIGALRAGRSVQVPVYDFSQYCRRAETVTLQPTPIVVVEGILVLYEPAVRDLMDLRVFVDADADVRFIRRLERDVQGRGRTPESVIAQYLETVRPAHLQFIEPSKRYADVIIPHGGMNEPAIEMLLARISAVTPTT
jgi:uridine kinase